MEQAKSPRTLIVELCRQFYDQGWVSGTGGGISIREGDRVYMAPSGVQKERIAERDLYVFDQNGEILERPADPQLKPSACLPLFFNAFPLPQREAGTRQTLRYIGEVLESGYSVLIFPEGKRSEHGEIAPFRPGIGMIASKLDVPVVPVRLDGLDRILHHTWKWPRRGPARVAFGRPLRLQGDDYLALAAEVEAAVRAL